MLGGDPVDLLGPPCRLSERTTSLHQVHVPLIHDGALDPLGLFLDTDQRCQAGHCSIVARIYLFEIHKQNQGNIYNK